MKLRVALAAAAILAAAAPSLSARAPAPPAPSTGLPGQNPSPPPESGASDAVPIPPIPPRIAEGDQYDRCMDMLGDDPEGAEALANSWTNGGEAAKHCHALALIALGNPQEGAPMLAQLAQTSQAPASARAEVFGQAASAYTMAGDADAALQAATEAITLAPEDPDLRVIHALAALARKQGQAALDDLNAALEADPKRADLLSLRATAHRQLDQLPAAQADIAAACALDPDNADALLERGILRQRAGDIAGARQDWEKAKELAPDTDTADHAEQNLALLEAGPAQ